jgi:hypothetical protein
LTLASLRPRLSTVSIIPGIENLAPERTLTSNGSVASPRFRPIAFSNLVTWTAISSERPEGQPPFMYAMQASVEIVKPGGTGSFNTLVISARLAPLPPEILVFHGERRCL